MNATRDAAPDHPGTATNPVETVAIPVVEERARIGKREVDGDRLRVTTRTDLVAEHVSETLRTDAVKVTRVPVDRTLTPGEPAPAIRTEGNTTIIPVLEEIVIVEKRFVLKEEIHILREITTADVDVPVTLRKQRAVIDRISADDDVGDNTGDHHGLT